MPPTNNRPGRPVLWALAVVLTPLTLFLLSNGFGSILGRQMAGTYGPGDLHRRWVEEACVRDGKNPNAVMDGNLPPPAAGRPGDADYPPWSLVFGLLFTLDSWRATTYLAVVENLIACAALGVWAARTVQSSSPLVKAVIVLSVLAIGTNRALLDAGQYTIITCALLAFSLLLHNQGRSWLAGLALGLAQVKYSVSLPFCLCFLVTMQWRTLVSAGFLVVTAALLSWPMIHVPPWIAFQQSVAVGVTFATTSPSPLKALIHLGLSPRLAVYVNAVGMLAIATVLMWYKRRDSMLVLFAFACYAARMWTYHLYYDDSVMMFLLAALGARALANQGDAVVWDWVAYLAVGISLWMTLGFLHRWPVVAAQCLIWTLGIVWIAMGRLYRTQFGFRFGSDE